jgi:hypothetical protein
MDAGVTLIRTADLYGLRHNEFLLRVREALNGRTRERVPPLVKIELLRSLGGGRGGIDTPPAAAA